MKYVMPILSFHSRRNHSDKRKLNRNRGYRIFLMDRFGLASRVIGKPRQTKAGTLDAYYLFNKTVLEDPRVQRAIAEAVNSISSALNEALIARELGKDNRPP